MPLPTQPPKSAIFIYGPPASGKSSLGYRLAEALELPFYDLDQVIEAQSERSIPEIFAAEGEAGFRQRESAALADVLQWERGVVALGGGALLEPRNRTRVESAGRVLCLAASFEAICERLGSTEDGRPLLSGDTKLRLKQLLEQRAAHYASFPCQLDSTTASPDEIAWQAQVRLGLFRVRGMGAATLSGAAYDVCIAAGSLAELGAALQARHLRGPLALVSDDNVAAHYAPPVLGALRQAGYAAQLVVIPAGEAHKTMDTVLRLWNASLEAGLERGSTVVALGGGVVGDLAGFAAATYLRGVKWVTVPTSLLAMVDASLGGKTGADLPQGKNLVGAFHSPALVLADPHTLATLPVDELRNGLAEVVKHGVLGDPRLFELCSQGEQAARANLDEIVRRAVAVKVRVIQEDPFERGRRASLNLGHTLGHAVEVVSGYGLKHGEGVAIGMVQAARLAERLGMAEQGLAQTIQNALQGLGLPVEIPPGLDAARLLAAMGLDKKRAGGKLRLVLPVRIGEVRWGVEVERPSALLEN
jgi:3-dehydroquinate synthase